MKAWDERENKKLLPPRDTVLQQQWYFAEFYECVVVQNPNFLVEKFLFVQNFMNFVVFVDMVDWNLLILNKELNSGKKLWQESHIVLVFMKDNFRFSSEHDKYVCYFSIHLQMPEQYNVVNFVM